MEFVFNIYKNYYHIVLIVYYCLFNLLFTDSFVIIIECNILFILTCLGVLKMSDNGMVLYAFEHNVKDIVNVVISDFSHIPTVLKRDSKVLSDVFGYSITSDKIRCFLNQESCEDYYLNVSSSAKKDVKINYHFLRYDLINGHILDKIKTETICSNKERKVHYDKSLMTHLSDLYNDDFEEV